jgi:hypothetical protein
MRLSSAAAIAILLGLALILSACGKDGTSAVDRPAGTVSNTSPSEPVGQAAAKACHQLRGFNGAMSTLRDELARGLSYDYYLREVRSVRSLYARIDVDELSAGCLLATGGPAERAFNLYIDAANAWGDCLATVSCDTRSIEPELQRKWALAARRLAVAQRGLRPARAS